MEPNLLKVNTGNMRKTDEQIISKKDSLNQKSIAGFNESINLTEEIEKEIEKLKQIIIEEKNDRLKSKNKIKDLIETKKSWKI